MSVDRRLQEANEARELEGLLIELRRVAVPEVDALHAIIHYRAKQLGLFGDRALPPELEVVRVLRELAMQKRITIARDEQDGRCLTIRMRSGKQWIVRLIEAPRVK